MKPIDLILSVLLLTLLSLTIFYIFKERVEQEDNDKIYSLDLLCEWFKKIIGEIINSDLDELNLNKKDLENRRAVKRALSDAIRKCSHGDLNAKMIVLNRAKRTILNVFNVTEDVINDIIPFDDRERLTAKDKFDILMYLQKKEAITECLREYAKQLVLTGFCMTVTDIITAYQTGILIMHMKKRLFR